MRARGREDGVAEAVVEVPDPLEDRLRLRRVPPHRRRLPVRVRLGGWGEEEREGKRNGGGVEGEGKRGEGRRRHDRGGWVAGSFFVGFWGGNRRAPEVFASVCWTRRGDRRLPTGEEAKKALDGWK